MLTVVARRKTNPQTFGELFNSCYDEIQNMTLKGALILLPELFNKTMKKFLVLSEERIKKLVAYFVNSLPAWLKGKMLLLNCES